MEAPNFLQNDHSYQVPTHTKATSNTKRSAFDNLTNANHLQGRAIEKKVSSQLVSRKIKAREPLRSVIQSEASRNYSGPKKSESSRKKNESTKDDDQTEETSRENIVEVDEIRVVNARPAPVRNLPPGVEWDIDLINWLNPSYVPEYAAEIFEYLKGRETVFRVQEYMDRQEDLTPLIRAMLVDWMVEVQQCFRLNHETLYKAVKLADLFLMKFSVLRDDLQLLGATSLYIMSKFDEQNHVTINDLLYICDDNSCLTAMKIIYMEEQILKVVKFDLGIPDSYTFLRRYSECARLNFTTLLLARYVLEYSLMNYDTVSFSDSKMAAAALFIATQMRGSKGWTTTMEYYSGYKIDEFVHIVLILNENLRKSYYDCNVIRHKYAHENFLKVANIPLKQNYELNLNHQP